jgi:exosome complex component RRP41
MAGILDPIIGLRNDGRKPNELRKIYCEVGVFADADGSAMIQQGNTKVVATVYGPHEVIFK